MRIWYVVGEDEYWLEPEYQQSVNGRVRLIGCKLYTHENKFKGYWHAALMPRNLKADLVEQVKAAVKRIERAVKEEQRWLRKVK